MVLSVSVAYADDLTDTSTVNAWTTTSGAFATTGVDDGVGVTTDTAATATHPVDVGADGVFSYQVGVQVNSLDNEAMIGVYTDTGAHYTLYYSGNNLYLNGDLLGAIDFDPTSGTTFTLWSDDGANVNYDIGGFNDAFPANGIPTSIEISLTNGAGDAGPVVYSLSFTAPGHPSIVTVPEAMDSTYDVSQVQNYYDNIYPLLYVQQANYGMTSATSFKVSGTVTAAANGNPIEGASVLLGNTLQKTDSLGKFTFSNIGMGVTDIAVSASGFASQAKSVNVNADTTQNFALDNAAIGSSTVASAANESANVTAGTNVTMPANATIAPTMAPTTAPAPTQTKSPGFEGIVAAIAMIGAAGALVYLNKKH
jgi:hypothetical protein